MEYYLAMKRNEVLINVYNINEPRKHTKWNKSETKEKYVLFHLGKISRIGRVIKTESMREVTRGSEEEEICSSSWMSTVSAWNDAKVLERNSGGGWSMF